MHHLMPHFDVVVFDLGKVLLDFDYTIAARSLSPLTHRSPEEILQLLLHTPLLHQYEIGELTSPAFYEAFARQTGLRAPFPVFASRFGNIFSPIPPMLDLLDCILASQPSTAVLSNTNDLAVQYIRTHFPFFSRFSHHILSFEHRAMKPDPHLYRVLEQQSGAQPSRILFLDDRPENVAAAQQLGWQAFIHRDPTTTRNEFRNRGLLPQ